MKRTGIVRVFTLVALALLLLMVPLTAACSTSAPSPSPTPTPKSSPALTPSTAAKPTSTPSPTTTATNPKSIRFLGAPVGSSTTMMIEYLCKLVETQLKIPIGAFPGGAEKNMPIVNEGNAELSYAASVDAYNAYNGVEPVYKQKQTNLRFICHYNTTLIAFYVRADNKIQKIEDMVGKRVALGTKGSAADVQARWVLEAGYGITPETITKAGGVVSYLSYEEMGNNLLDGISDVVCMLPTSEVVKEQVQAAEERYGVRVLPLNEEARDKIIKKYPFFVKEQINSGVYKKEPKAVPLLALPFVIVCHKDLPEQLVYDITSIFLSPKTNAELVARDPSRKLFTLENGLRGAVIPLHPGAARLYTEKGIKLPEGVTVLK